MKIKLYTISVFAENKSGVLYRVTDVFLKRKINIESLTASQIDSTMSKIIVTTKINKLEAEKIVKQLNKIIEVRKVTEGK
jgi:acetolactate synthase-1/3 small subunit